MELEAQLAAQALDGGDAHVEAPAQAAYRALVRDGEHQHRPGLDITLSAPKSVSLEGLVFGERRVVRAHDEAVRETLDWIEADLLQTRGYDPATGRRPRERAHGMVAALFRHLKSRNQDPQLHTHCVVANMTRNAEGEWRSLEATKVRRSEKLIGAYYRTWRGRLDVVTGGGDQSDDSMQCMRCNRARWRELQGGLHEHPALGVVQQAGGLALIPWLRSHSGDVRSDTPRYPPGSPGS